MIAQIKNYEKIEDDEVPSNETFLNKKKTYDAFNSLALDEQSSDDSRQSWVDQLDQLFDIWSKSQ